VPGISDCQVADNAIIGGGSLIASCGLGAFARYAFPGGPWQKFAADQQCVSDADPVNDGACTPFAVGTRWLELAITCRCKTSYLFQDLATGAVSDQPSSGAFRPRLGLV
jgi:hypothetical protein